MISNNRQEQYALSVSLSLSTLPLTPYYSPQQVPKVTANWQTLNKKL